MQSQNDETSLPQQNAVVHTPGPWVFFSRSGIVEVQCDGKTPIAGWTGFDDSDRELAEHEANARLIAAAPDLLAACQYLMRCITEGTTQVFEQDPEYDQSPLTACELIESAIRKATSVE